MTRNPHIKRIVTPEPIPQEQVEDWHAFINTLPDSWWVGKTAHERGVEAMKLWKEKEVKNG